MLLISFRSRISNGPRTLDSGGSVDDVGLQGFLHPFRYFPPRAGESQVKTQNRCVPAPRHVGESGHEQPDADQKDQRQGDPSERVVFAGDVLFRKEPATAPWNVPKTFDAIYKVAKSRGLRVEY